MITRSTKTSKYIILEELDHDFVVIGFACNGLHPFGHMVHNNKKVEVAKRVWERSHKVNASHIKNFHNQDEIVGNHILSRNIP
jgi:hypothetical protein